MAESSPRFSVARLIFTGIYLLFWPALVFALAGDWRWLQGWIFSSWFVALCATCIVWLYVKDPALLAERYRAPGSGGQQGWDKYVVYALGILFAAWIAVMPLDAKRFRWTHPLPVEVQCLGGLLLLSASFLFFRSFADNTFLSPLVRVQSERKQSVVSTGVYSFVRHPMYLGASLMFLGAPLLLGSWVGLLIGVTTVLLLAARIVGEEKMLLQRLDGYADYRKAVRYRLFPGIW